MTEQTTVPPAAPAGGAPTEEEPTGRLARLARLQALQIIIVLAVIVVVFSILKPSSFLTVFNIRGIVQNTAILAVLGVGMTFVIITGGMDLRNVPTVMVNSVGFGNIVWQIPWLAVIAAVVVVLGIVLLHRTRFGLHTYAIGSNPEAGRRSGVNVPRHLVGVYALSGLLAGFGGWLNLAFFQSTTIGGQTSTNLSVIAGVVIGGTSLFGGYGSILGSVIGVFIPAALQNGFVIIGIQPFWQQVVVGAVLIAAVSLAQQRRAAA